MGCIQAVQPLFSEVSVGVTPHSCFECCQHAVRPYVSVRPLPYGRRLSGRCSRERHCCRLVFLAYVHSTFTSLRPFAPPVLAGFNATMDALTPTHGPCLEGAALFVSPEWRPTRRPGQAIRRWFAFNHSVPQGVTPKRGQVSLCPSLHLPSILPPTTPCRPDAMSGVYLTIGLTVGRVLRTHRTLTGHASWVSPLASRLTTATGRIEFALADCHQLVLRTGRSPPVAPHPALRRRSYLRLRGARRSSTRTFTSLMQRHYRRTSRRL